MELNLVLGVLSTAIYGKIVRCLLKSFEQCMCCNRESVTCRFVQPRHVSPASGAGRGARWLSGRASDSGARGRGVRNLPPSCCILEQDTLLSESTGNTRKAVAPSRHDSKIVDWDVKHQHKANKTCIG